MTDSYCGKPCGECTYKEEMKCSGCKQGPGRDFGGTCELANCARSRKHTSCATCSDATSCGIYHDRFDAPSKRKRQEEQAAKKEANYRHLAPVFSVCYQILSWTIIPMVLACVLQLCGLFFKNSALYILGMSLSALWTLTYGVVLLVMAKESLKFLLPAAAYLLMFINRSLTVVSIFLPDVDVHYPLLFLLLGMAAMYFESSAHSSIPAIGETHVGDEWNGLCRWMEYDYRFATFYKVARLIWSPAIWCARKVICLRHSADLFRRLRKKFFPIVEETL